ncbi:hypothetical protein ACA910_008809 [Epithemia clementina (nom. ined.)]
MWSMVYNNSSISSAAAAPSLYDEQQALYVDQQSLSAESAAVVSKTGSSGVWGRGRSQSRTRNTMSTDSLPSKSESTKSSHMRSLSPASRGRSRTFTRSATSIDSFARSDGKMEHVRSMCPESRKNLRLSRSNSTIPNSLPGEEKHRRLRSLSPDSVRSSVKGRFSKSSSSVRSMSNPRDSYKYRDRNRLNKKSNMATTHPCSIVIYEPTRTVPSKTLEQQEPETYFTSLLSLYEYVTGTPKDNSAPSPQSSRILVYQTTHNSESTQKTPQNMQRRGKNLAASAKDLIDKDDVPNEKSKSGEDVMTSFQNMLQSITASMSWESKELAAVQQPAESELTKTTTMKKNKTKKSKKSKKSKKEKKKAESSLPPHSCDVEKEETHDTLVVQKKDRELTTSAIPSKDGNVRRGLLWSVRESNNATTKREKKKSSKKGNPKLSKKGNKKSSNKEDNKLSKKGNEKALEKESDKTTKQGNDKKCNENEALSKETNNGTSKKGNDKTPQKVEYPSVIKIKKDEDEESARTHRTQITIDTAIRTSSLAGAVAAGNEESKNDKKGCSENSPTKGDDEKAARSIRSNRRSRQLETDISSKQAQATESLSAEEKKVQFSLGLMKKSSNDDCIDEDADNDNDEHDYDYDEECDDHDDDELYDDDEDDDVGDDDESSDEDDDDDDDEDDGEESTAVSDAVLFDACFTATEMFGFSRYVPDLNSGKQAGGDDDDNQSQVTALNAKFFRDAMASTVHAQ